VRAAAELNTCIVLSADHIGADIKKYTKNIIPLISHKEIDKHQALIKSVRMVAIDYHDEVLSALPALQDKIKKINNVLTIVRVPATKSVEDIVAKLAQNGAEIIHVVADYRGMENSPAGADRRLAKDIIRTVHLKLVEDRIRDEVTIIFSGGIAMAEHVPKAMICGADLTAIDLPLLIALGARVYEEPEKIILLPEKLEKVAVRTVMHRIVNLMGAWHSQLLEVMGAMGIREARRLRGETGRAIFFDEIDNDTFGKIFKKRESAKI
jgi:glutamate synthase domain-containing protein 2